MGEEKNSESIMRRDSGELRLFISIAFAVVSGFAFYYGYELIKQGVAGEFKILAGYSGLTLYFTSISPGVLFGVLGMLLLAWGLPRALKAL